MKIQKLKLTNWKHIEGEKEVNFFPGFNILLGPNFIGKTSILEALQYAITGTLPAYKSKEKDKNWIHISTPRSDVEVFFEHDQKDYIVRRSIKNRVVKGDVTEEIILLEDDKEISIARGSDVNKKIKDYLPWDEYSVNKVAFMSDDIVNEINKGQKDLFKALKEVLSFKELQEYIVEIKKIVNDLSKEKDTLSKEIDKFQSQSTDANKELAELEKEALIKERDVVEKQKVFDAKKRQKEKIIEGKQKQEAIESKNKELEEFLKRNEEKKPEDFDKKLTFLKNDLESNQKEYFSIKEEFDIRKGRQEMLNQILVMLESSEEEDCPVCNKLIKSEEKLELLHDHRLTKEKNNKRQVERQKELENKLLSRKEIEQNIQKFTNLKINLVKLTTEINQLTQGFDPKTDFKKEYEGIKDSITLAEKELKEEGNKYNEINSKILKLKAELDFQAKKLPNQLKKVTKEFHKNSILKEVLEKTENDFVLEMLQSIKTELESTWSNIQSETIVFDIGNQKGLDLKVKRNEKDLKIIELSGSERKILILIIALLLNKKFFNYPLLTIDEPFEPLDSINNEKLQNIFLTISGDNQIICTTVKNIAEMIVSDRNKDKINVIDLQSIWN
jgi:chromosome segregation protein